MAHEHRKAFLGGFCMILLLLLTISLLIPAGSLEPDCSESYRTGIFYQRLRNVELTGDSRTDIIRVAMSQIGYIEGNSSTQLSGCAQQAGIPEDIFYQHAYTPYGVNWYSDRGLSYTRAQIENGAYVPQPGDLVYFLSPGVNRKVNHVGLVLKYEDGILYAIEGNTNAGDRSTDGGQVCLKSYEITDTFIRYICTPQYE